MRILIVEDEIRLAEHLKELLQNNSYDVSMVHDGQAAWDILSSDAFDAIILDWLLPEISGIDICQRLRDRGDKTPVLFLSAQSALKHRVEGLSVGADDYLTKPFHSEELLIRLSGLIRRSHQPPISIFNAKVFTFDASKNFVHANGQSIELSHKESAILALLFQERGKIIPKERFLKEVWGYDFDPKTNTLEVYIKMLRSKLKALSTEKLILTKRGEGYYIESDK